MHKINPRVLRLSLSLVTDSSEVKHFHIEESGCDSHSKCLHFEERFGEYGEQIPILLSERTGSQLVVIAYQAYAKELND